MKWLDHIPLLLLLPIAIVLGISLIGQQPYLLQKLSMLMNGELNKAIDVFDLLMYGTPRSCFWFG